MHCKRISNLKKHWFTGGKLLSIFINKIGEIRHVSVVGELVSKNQSEYLCSLIEENQGFGSHITFFDANIVPVEVVEKLFDYQKKRGFKIFVLKTYLYSYFYNLGVKCTYIKNKSILKGSSMLHLSKAKYKGFNEEQVVRLLKNIKEKYGYDYMGYHIESIMRRIKISMLRYGIDDFSEFMDVVIEEQGIFEQLFLDLSINITEFFRDTEVFYQIKNNVLPYLNSYSHVKIWCVGCSNGKEPYSLAILLYELGMLDKSQVYATDLNPYVIEEAKNGLYSINTFEKDKINYLKSGGAKSFSHYFDYNSRYIKVKDFLKEKVLFFQHSLEGNGILNEFELIICRNVLIYFNIDMQKKVIEYFYNSLDLSGFLILGKSEGMLQNNGYKYFDKHDEIHRIYRRRSFD